MIHHVSFKHAFDGIVYAFKSQPNMRFHALAAVVVVSLGVHLTLAPLEWLIIAFSIALMFTTEMINTAIESMTDLLTKEHHQSAKIAKDTAAGMVLLNAIASIVVAAIIFVPKLFGLTP